MGTKSLFKMFFLGLISLVIMVKAIDAYSKSNELEQKVGSWKYKVTQIKAKNEDLKRKIEWIKREPLLAEQIIYGHYKPAGDIVEEK